MVVFANRTHTNTCIQADTSKNSANATIGDRASQDKDVGSDYTSKNSSDDSDDGFVKVSLTDGKPESPLKVENELSVSPASPIACPSSAPVASSNLQDVMARRASNGTASGSATDVSDKLKPAMHSLETDLKRQAVKAVLTPALENMQQEVVGSGSDSPYSAAQKQKRGAVGVVASSHTAPVIAAAASSVKTKIAGQEVCPEYILLQYVCIFQLIAVSFNML